MSLKTVCTDGSGRNVNATASSDSHHLSEVLLTGKRVSGFFRNTRKIPA